MVLRMSHTSTPITADTASGTILGELPLDHDSAQSSQEAVADEARDRYVALSPDGRKIVIPKELFVVLSDFLKTRRCPGSVTVDFRCDEIVGIEALTKKRFSSKL